MPVHTDSIALIVYDDVQMLDVAGPSEVFAMAARILGEQTGHAQAYAISVLSSRGGEIRSSSGMRLLTTALATAAPDIFDVVLVAGGQGAQAASADRELLAWLQRAQPHVRWIGSVCTGAFVVGAAGLLDGYRAVTHWKSQEALARRFPQAQIVDNVLFVVDRQRVSSAGVTAGMDLALHLVETDHGTAIANAVARSLVMFMQRAGAENQRSAPLFAQAAESSAIDKVLAILHARFNEQLSAVRLAGEVHTSTRTLQRQFKQRTGYTVHGYLENYRLAIARGLLEKRIDEEHVARNCGFRNARQLRRLINLKHHETRAEPK